MSSNRLTGIYAIVDAGEGSPLDQLATVLTGGIRLVQYRSKSGIDRVVLRSMHERVRAVGGCLIVNDDLASLADADGIHLGQEDLLQMDRSSLRKAVGEKILGLSCPDVGTAIEAQSLGADYIGVGAMYATGTKSDAGAPIGPPGVSAAVAAVRIPVVAIGGISLDRIAEVRATGAAMAAVITAISRAADPIAAARSLVEAWQA